MKLRGSDMTKKWSRLSYEVIEKILTDPRSVNPRATMPPAVLSHEERDRLASFLVGMK